MISMTRIDYRLLHGQVAFAWSNFLSVNAILIANDSVVKDDFRKQALRLAKPSGSKLIFKSVSDSVSAINSGVTDKYRVLVVTENVDDAYRLIKNTGNHIQLLDVGLVSEREGTRNIAKAVYLTPVEENKLLELENAGVSVVVKQAPNDPDTPISSLVKSCGEESSK
ncbi:PTS sugar transporter subunit IIB [Lacticaseibacillus suibinensis]|uniref:PTS sugar transporter subunit IIB n=1 Tax=Lacticaseibacillus suibinensis TaxID=2486011 RepID=UPI000F7A7997|nr:PTS sugar transporter subunit IIB [Lacticaseibacillus suibinensis]